jgi:hypothetical protein
MKGKPANLSLFNKSRQILGLTAGNILYYLYFMFSSIYVESQNSEDFLIKFILLLS